MEMAPAHVAIVLQISTLTWHVWIVCLDSMVLLAMYTTSLPIFPVVLMMTLQRECDCVNGAECDDGIFGDGSCKCLDGYNPSTNCETCLIESLDPSNASRCQECLPGFYGETCTSHGGSCALVVYDLLIPRRHSDWFCQCYWYMRYNGLCLHHYRIQVSCQS